MQATSSYLNRPTRTEQQAKADELRRMLAFARRHDWGGDAWIEWEDEALLIPTEAVCSETCEVVFDIEIARSMRELRQIAGY